MDDAATRQISMNSEDQGTVNKSSATDGSTNLGKVNLTRETVQLPLLDDASATDEKLHTKPPSKGHEGTTEKAQEERGEMESSTAKKVVTFEVTTQPLAQPIKLAPKEWRALHDEWLNSTMRAEMEDESLQGIPTMMGYCAGKRSMLTNKKPPVVPTRGFVVRYDLRIKAIAGENPVESAREALAAWFTKIKEIDKNAIIYPWTSEDRKNKEKCLEKSSDLPFLLSNMKKYFHKLYI